MLRRLLAPLLATAVSLVAAAPSSGAAGVATHSIGGFPADVACMTATSCVAVGYNNHGVGDVALLRNGVTVRVSVLGGTQGAYAISCPSTSGCIGLVRTSNDVGVEMVAINAAGAVTRTWKYSSPSGALLDRLACVALTRCELAGSNIFTSPPSIEVASWGGSSLSFHRASVPGHPVATIVEDVSCVATSCDVVGYLSAGATNIGVSLEVTGGTTLRLRTVGHDSLYGVSCVSAVRCYAVGFNPAGGVLVTLVSGAATATTSSSSELSDISCTASTCSAVASTPAVPAVPGKYWGVEYTTVNGAIIGATDVPAASSLAVVARFASTWTAVGTAQGGAFVVATTG